MPSDIINLEPVTVEDILDKKNMLPARGVLLLQVVGVPYDSVSVHAHSRLLASSLRLRWRDGTFRCALFRPCIELAHTSWTSEVAVYIHTAIPSI